MPQNSDQKNSSITTKISSIATIIGVFLAAIALIPAFGQWLYPRQPIPIVTPTKENSTSTPFPQASGITPTPTVKVNNVISTPSMVNSKTSTPKVQMSGEIVTPTKSSIQTYLSSENVEHYQEGDIELPYDNDGSIYQPLEFSGIEFAVQTEVEWDTVSNSENLSNIGCGFRVESYRHELMVFIALDGYSYSYEKISDDNNVSELINEDKAKYGNPSNLSGMAKIGIVLNEDGYSFFVNDKLILTSVNLSRNSTYTDTFYVSSEKFLVYSHTACRFRDINIWIAQP
ncbi:MAG TPA: hypothetical protein PKL52_11250 [Tenuifilaceae bacterium]|nr:hypothetical protein [Tenuifilaceae bacterium]